MGDLREVAVGLFHDVGLRDDGHIVFAVVLGVLESGTADALSAGFGGDFEVEGEFVGDFHAFGTEDVFAFGVLTEEDPVDVLRGNFGWADVRIEVELTTHGDVRALHGTAGGGGGRALHDDVAGLELSKDVVRDGFSDCETVLDSEAVDIFEFDFAGSDVVLQQEFDQTSGLSCDDRADAVAAAEADDDVVEICEVFLLVVCFHSVFSLELFLEERLEVRGALFYIGVIFAHGTVFPFDLFNFLTIIL